MKQINKNIDEIIKILSKENLYYGSITKKYKKEIEVLNTSIIENKEKLKTIMDSKYYKIWRLYCKIKDLLM